MSLSRRNGRLLSGGGGGRNDPSANRTPARTSTSNAGALNPSARGSGVAQPAVNYEPPNCLPIKPSCLRTFESTIASHTSSRSVRDNISTALELLAKTAADLAEWVPADLNKSSSKYSLDDDEEEEDCTDNKGTVKEQNIEGDKLLKELESTTRKIIDRAWEIDEGYKILNNEVKNFASKQNNDDSEDILGGLWNVYESEMEPRKEAYNRQTIRERYEKQAEYVRFRGLVWEAQHDGEEMPPSRTWFLDDKPKKKRKGTQDSGDGSEGDSDSSQDSQSESDFEVQGSKRSLTCPITLLPFTHPVTSKVCPHSFEKEAILSMIRSSHNFRQQGITDGSSGPEPYTHPRVNEPRPGYEKVTACPVGGCTRVLGENDLRPDMVLERKIQREKERREMELEDSLLEDGSGTRKAIEVGDESFVDADAVTQGASASVSAKSQVKQEVARTARRAQNLRPTTLVLDGGDDEDGD